VWVRIPPPVPNVGQAFLPVLFVNHTDRQECLSYFARVAQLEEAADLRSAFMMSSNLSTRTKDSGALGKPGSSRLIFNQEMRGFESHTPCQLRANADRDYISKMSRHARSLSPFFV
jgi:hypothetical protein